ncbi:MAG: hypothetical protein AAF574_16345 [Pseudomonadota bacterium]
MSKPKPQEDTSLPVRLIAELAVIVLGVLIALWADGWVADRQDRKKEAARIAALRDNVVATRERLATAIDDTDQVAGALREIVYWEGTDDFGPKKKQTLMIGYLFGPRFTPEMNVYDDLENSGELALLTSDPLRQALARMSAALFTIGVSQQDLLTVQQMNFDRFIVDNLAIGYAPGSPFDLDNIPVGEDPPLPEMRIIRNLALFKLDLIGQLRRQYESADAALARVLEEIDVYLE